MITARSQSLVRIAPPAWRDPPRLAFAAQTLSAPLDSDHTQKRRHSGVPACIRIAVPDDRWAHQGTSIVAPSPDLHESSPLQPRKVPAAHLRLGASVQSIGSCAGRSLRTHAFSTAAGRMATARHGIVDRAGILAFSRRDLPLIGRRARGALAAQCRKAVLRATTPQDVFAPVDVLDMHIVERRRYVLVLQRLRLDRDQLAVGVREARLGLHANPTPPSSPSR